MPIGLNHPTAGYSSIVSSAHADQLLVAFIVVVSTIHVVTAVSLSTAVLLL